MTNENYKIIEKIFSVKNCDKHKVIVVCGLKLKIKSQKLIQREINKKLENNINKLQNNLSEEKKQTQKLANETISQNKQISNLNKKLSDLDKKLSDLDNKFSAAIKRLTPQTMLNNMDYHLAEHCNLNCKNCDHFSPLAKPAFTEVSEFENDIKQFAKLSNQSLGTLNLLGGEPLLHPQVIDFLRISRQYLPNTTIQLVSNGILINQQPSEFWEACNKYNIKIVITKYPLEINFDKAIETAKKHNVVFEFYGNREFILKTSYHIPLDLEGKQNPTESFMNCFHANHCVMLKHGRIYPCTVAPNIEHFNNYFNYNIPLTDKDGIDIHNASSIDEILNFISKPIPFCRFCNVKCRTFKHEWGVSKKEITEWSINNA